MLPYQLHQKLRAAQQQNSSSNLSILKGLPFWIWDKEEHRQQAQASNGNCCFQHIRCSHEAEGKYTQQTKQIVTTLNRDTGEHIQDYHMGSPRDAYTIPWDKKKANELLVQEKIFGEDSINISNLSECQYVVKFSGNPARTSFGMSDFLDLKYDKLQELSRTVKSPYLADLERRVNPYK
jgi:hypothetical protein